MRLVNSIITLSIVMTAMSAQAKSDYPQIIVKNGCAAVEEEYFSKTATRNCLNRGQELISEFEGRAFNKGRFILDLCDAVPQGGFLKPNYRTACLIGIARNSQDLELQTIFNDCSRAILAGIARDGGLQCFTDGYRRL